MRSYKSYKEIAAEVRETLKKELPEWKFSVRKESYSGGGSVTVSLMAGPEEVSNKNYAQLNPYTFLSCSGYGREKLESNGTQLTPKGFEVLELAAKVLAKEHWDDSDIQTDYFSCAYYMHIEIGQWNKPYTVTKPKSGS